MEAVNWTDQDDPWDIDLEETDETDEEDEGDD